MDLFLKISVLQENFCWLGDLEEECCWEKTTQGVFAICPKPLPHPLY